MRLLNPALAARVPVQMQAAITPVESVCAHAPLLVAAAIRMACEAEKGAGLASDSEVKPTKRAAGQQSRESETRCGVVRSASARTARQRQSMWMRDTLLLCAVGAATDSAGLVWALRCGGANRPRRWPSHRTAAAMTATVCVAQQLPRRGVRSEKRHAAARATADWTASHLTAAHCPLSTLRCAHPAAVRSWLIAIRSQSYPFSAVQVRP